MYIHRATCISPQHTFGEVDIDPLNISVNNQLHIIEPPYPDIPPGLLRRMGKAVRVGVGAALPLLRHGAAPDGIIIGTANGGMEDCIKFLNQIIKYEEGMLTPGNFVQSTPNAIASQIGLLNANKHYNITHVHRGLAFENAVLDADMLVRENPSGTYLLGAVDEISTYNYNIDYLDGWYKKEIISNKNLYETNSPASIAGEGSAMFLVNGKNENALARLANIHIIHTDDEILVKNKFSDFVKKNSSVNEKIDLFISGENGDNRLLKYYTACENVLPADITVARFKHMSGEFPTASAIATWLACHIIESGHFPQHIIKRKLKETAFRKILLYNNFKGEQHSFMMISKS